MADVSIAKAAIVGATGATGIALAQDLVARGIGVRAIARTGANLERLFGGPSFERATADARDPAALLRAVDGCDLIVDCIGLPAAEMADHARAARSIAAALKQTGARGLQVSSFWAYLPVQKLPLDEAHPRDGGNPSIRARRAAEDILQQAGAAIVNLPDFFGPHVGTSTLQQPLAEAAQGRTMNWIGSRHTEREYIFVPDAMRLVAALALRAEAYGERWLFPGAGPLSGNAAADHASRALGRTVRVRSAGTVMLRLAALASQPLRDFLPMVPHYVQPIRYDAGKLAKLLGPPPLTPYGDAIAQTLAWLKRPQP